MEEGGSSPTRSGTGAKKRLVLVVQSDAYNQAIQNTLVAEITSNLTHATDPAHLLIEVSTPESAWRALNSVGEFPDWSDNSFSSALSVDGATSLGLIV